MNNYFFKLDSVSETSGTGRVCMTSSARDRDGEKLDYWKAKPEIIRWAKEQAAASGSRNFGNLRLQHDGGKPIGLITSMPEFDDQAEKVFVNFRVVDPTAKELLEGVP